MPWRKPERPPVKEGEHTTFIEEGSEIDGKFTFVGTVVFNGRIRGEIASNDTLIIGEKGVVNANIRAGVVQIGGEVVGDVVASDRVELKEKCRVYGDVSAPVVIIAEGALFEGQCRMTKGRPADAVQQPVRDLSLVPKRSELPR
ncbi:MAG TPA: polymer-forming cytoskeletal protein [Gemmatimonadaceae bacterium]|nr:polymer-forming cytoskeletal protein [Gemmatimonadaceae bacterium]